MHIHTSDLPEMNLGFRDYRCNWGTHILGLYETEDERDEIIFGYLHQGNTDGDLQLYVPYEKTEQAFRRDYARTYPQEARDLDDSDRFHLRSAQHIYYPHGTFSPWEMEDSLNTFFWQSQKHGSRNIRATAEMIWALEKIPGVQHLMAYESRLNYFIEGKPWISICMYNVNKIPGSMILTLLKTHPWTINGGVLTKNPYYLVPEEFLAQYEPSFLEKSRPS